METIIFSIVLIFYISSIIFTIKTDMARRKFYMIFLISLLVLFVASYPLLSMQSGWTGLEELLFSVFVFIYSLSLFSICYLIYEVRHRKKYLQSKHAIQYNFNKQRKWAKIYIIFVLVSVFLYYILWSIHGRASFITDIEIFLVILLLLLLFVLSLIQLALVKFKKKPLLY